MKVSLVILTICTLSFVLVVILNSLITDKSVKINNVVKSVVDPATEVLPAAYVVPYTARTPAKDQGRRGTCWIFSTMGILEGLYRKNGVEKGFLKDDEYVSFSEQACNNKIKSHLFFHLLCFFFNCDFIHLFIFIQFFSCLM